MFGCFIMLFARSDCQNSFKSLKSVKNKTGTGGMTANKGSVALRFNFDDTSFMFMNCHLTSGQKAYRERFNDTSKNYSDVTQSFDNMESEPLIPGLHASNKRTQ